MQNHSLAIFLVLISAGTHVVYNILIKKCTDRLAATWLFLLCGVLLFFPASIQYWDQLACITPMQIRLYVLSGFLKAVYFYMLTVLYAREDFSKTYPVLRSSHVFIPFLSFLFLGEVLKGYEVLGAIVLWGGVFLVNMEELSSQDVKETFYSLNGKSFQYGIFTAFVVALYSIVDSAGVDTMHPLVFMPMMFFASLVFLSMYMAKNKRFGNIRTEWSTNWLKIIGIAMLNFGGYLLVLIAMTMTSVTVVMSIRQLSIIMGVVVGKRVFDEKALVPRLVGALVIVLGIWIVVLF